MPKLNASQRHPAVLRVHPREEEVIVCRLTARVGHIKMIAICIAYTRQQRSASREKMRGAGRQEYHVPLSGGNSPPAWMKLRKDEGARLNAPPGSVVILDISDRLETSRDMRSGPMWSRKRGLNNGTEGRSLRVEQVEGE